MDHNYWYRLDNTAKVYPSLSAKDKYDVFCTSFFLKEKIEPDTLQLATSQVLERFRCYKVRLKRGFFWYYLERNRKDFFIKKEEKSIFTPIDAIENNGYLFVVSYLENKISLSMSHILTDGVGALNFLKSIIFRYLELCGKNVKNDGTIITIDTQLKQEEVRDEYKALYKKEKVKLEKEKSAFMILGNREPYKHSTHFVLRMPTEQLVALAKSYGVSVNCFLTALITYSIYKTKIEGNDVKNKFVKTFIPVNLRPFFNSVSMRNFVGYFRVGHDFNEYLPFDKLAKSIQEQVNKKLDKEYLFHEFCGNVKLEKNAALRIAPLFIKDLAMRIGHAILGDELHTFSISNLGRVNFPPSMENELDSVVFYSWATRTGPFNLNPVSACGITNISMARYYDENDIERYFIQFLTDKGIDVTYLD